MSKYTTVLVIEDEPEFQAFFDYMLGKRGFKAKLADNAEDGIRMAREGGISVILLDLQLPDLKGEEVIAKLKSFPETKDIPVFAVSGYLDYGDKDKLDGQGFHDYFLKPVDFSRFFRSITSAIQEAHMKDVS